MNWIKKLLGLKTEKQCATHYVRLTLPYEELNEHQKTDLVINVQDAPFITLTESKRPNIWYHEELPYLFTYTARGFKVLSKGTKEDLFKRGFGR